MGRDPGCGIWVGIRGAALLLYAALTKVLLLFSRPGESDGFVRKASCACAWARVGEEPAWRGCDLPAK